MGQPLLEHTMKWHYVNRFLRAGNELGIHEVPVPDFWRTATPALDLCMRQDGPALVRLAVESLTAGRAHRPEPALFVLAKVIAEGPAAARQAALEALPGALKSGAHLFQLLAYLDDHAKWDWRLRTALRAWYTSRSTTELANVVLRSLQAGSWNHRKLLGIAEPNPPTPEHAALLRWLRGEPLDGALIHAPGLDLIAAYETLQKTDSLAIALSLLGRWPLLREHVPARWLTYPEVWTAVLSTLSLEALVRWIPRLADTELPVAQQRVHALAVERLKTLSALKTQTLSPFAALAALGAVQAGCRARALPVPAALAAALKAMFHQRLRATPRTLGTLVIAVDPAAGAMSGEIDTLIGLSPREAFAATALMAAAGANQAHVLAFGDGLVPIPIAPGETLDGLLAKLDAVPGGPPDGAAPMEWAIENGVHADAVLVLSANRPSPNANRIWASLLHYRARSERATRWLAVSCGEGRLCPEPPIDFDMLEVAGLDAQVPALVGDWLGLRR
jgi:60 kDa SS-A/Ro ribonucleoprotein